MADPSWWLGEPSWYLEPSPKREPASEPASKLPPVRLRSSDGGEMPQMVGAFASFNEWTEIRSTVEGHFLEQMSETAFERTITEDGDKIRVLFNHGSDKYFGHSVLGPIRSLKTDTSYEVDLLDTDYNKRLIPGLRANLYGASFRFLAVKDEYRPAPPRSDHNPGGLPEVTVTEAKVIEFGPTPFPAYKGSTAGVRSSREVVQETRFSAYSLGLGERWAARSKPGATGVLERERVLVNERASWERRRQRAWWWLHVAEEAVPVTRESWWLA